MGQTRLRYAVIAVDTNSGKGGMDKDPWAIQALARGDDGFAFDVDYRQGFTEFDDLWRNLFECFEYTARKCGGRNNREYQLLIRMVGVEDSNLGPYLVQKIRQCGQRDPQVWMPTKLISTGGKSKKVRAQPVATAIKRGLIKIRKDGPFTPLIKKQWFNLTFKGNPHDEAVDVMSYAFYLLQEEDQLIGAPGLRPLPHFKGDGDAGQFEAEEYLNTHLDYDPTYERWLSGEGRGGEEDFNAFEGVEAPLSPATQRWVDRLWRRRNG